MPAYKYPRYPPLLPRAALAATGGLQLGLFPAALRSGFTHRLQGGANRVVEISRTFLPLLNYNLVSHSEDQGIVCAERSRMNCLELPALRGTTM